MLSGDGNVNILSIFPGDGNGEKRKERGEEKGATLPSAHRPSSATNNSAAVRKVYETDIIWQNLTGSGDAVGSPTEGWWLQLHPLLLMQCQQICFKMQACVTQFCDLKLPLTIGTCTSLAFFIAIVIDGFAEASADERKWPPEMERGNKGSHTLIHACRYTWNN